MSAERTLETGRVTPCFAWTPGRDPLTLFWLKCNRREPVTRALRYAACMEAHARECEADTLAIASRAHSDLLDRLRDRATAYRLAAAGRLAAGRAAV